MSVSPACVAAVQDASGGRLSESDAADLIRSMEAVRKAEEAKGNLDNLDARVRQRAAEQAEKAQIAAALAKKHAALAAIAYQRSYDQVKGLMAGGLDARKAMLAMLEGTTRNVGGGRASLAATAMAYRDRYLQTINLALVRDKALARRVTSGDRTFAANVVREMRELREGGTPGRTGDDQAQALARVYAEAAELARQDLARHGAPIGKLDGWSPQSHAFERVEKVSAEEWIDFILPRLDRDKTFAGVSDESARQILRDIHREIIGNTPRNPSQVEQTGRVGPANLANALARSRTLHFRDADAWLSYAERFGGGNIHDAMLSHLQQAARSAAQMQYLGPNPKNTLTRLRETLAREVDGDQSIPAEKRAALSKALKPGGWTIDSAWEEASGMTAVPVSLRSAQIGTALRTWQTLAKLGGAVLSSLPDLQLRASALSYEGKPLLAAWRENLAGLIEGRGKGEAREIAALLNAGLDGMRGHIVAAGLAEDMPMGMAHRLTERLFRWQGQSWWTDMMKAGSARMLSRWMGLQRETGFDALRPDYQRTLTQQGITAAEWDLIRATAWQAEDGNWYVTPDRLAGIPAQGIARLAAPALDAIQKGLAERITRRAAADAQEAQWVARRTQRFQAELARAQQRMAAWSQTKGEAAERQVARLRERIDAVRAGLSDLAEFRAAAAEGRLDPDPDAGDLPFIPKAERFLHARDPAAEAALRGEGALREKLDRLRRAIGQVRQDATRGDVAMVEAFDAQWRLKEAELQEFVLRMQSRSDARAEATKAERADWEPRVQRVLAQARSDLDVKLRRFFADEMGFAVLEPDAASRRLTLQGSRPGSPFGELMRALAQFKGYPAAFTQRVLGRGWYGYEGDTATQRMMAGGGAHLGALILGLTFMGYLSMSLKDLARGWEPKDPTKPATILAALVQGGGAGIYGDYLFSQASRFGNGPLETAAGPLAGSAAGLIDLWLKARSGDAKGGEFLAWTLQNTPFVNLWYARPVLDYLILNEAREALSPGYLRRQEKSRRDDFGQERLVPRSVWE